MTLAPLAGDFKRRMVLWCTLPAWCKRSCAAFHKSVGGARGVLARNRARKAVGAGSRLTPPPRSRLQRQPPPGAELADDPPPERQHADDEDRPLRHRHPRSELRQVVFHRGYD